MSIVAISQEVGSGGYEIAETVAKTLNYDFLDRRILQHAAQALGVSVEVIGHAEEHRPSLMQRFDMERRRYLISLAAAYFTFAQKGRIVTVSRGGPFLVRGISHAVKVRIMAPVEVRVRRVIAKDGLGQRVAEARVRAIDREMAGCINYLFGVDRTSPANYDLVINTEDEKWGFYAELLVMAARHAQFQPTPESQELVRDLSLAAQIRAALANDSETMCLEYEVDAHLGRVALKCLNFRTETLQAATRVVHAVPGVTGVSFEIVDFLPLSQLS